jgi:hypothetical protein
MFYGVSKYYIACDNELRNLSCVFFDLCDAMDCEGGLISLLSLISFILENVLRESVRSSLESDSTVLKAEPPCLLFLLFSGVEFKIASM